MALVIVSHYLLRIFRGEVSKKIENLTSTPSRAVAIPLYAAPLLAAIRALANRRDAPQETALRGLIALPRPTEIGFSTTVLSPGLCNNRTNEMIDNCETGHPP